MTGVSAALMTLVGRGLLQLLPLTPSSRFQPSARTDLVLCKAISKGPEMVTPADGSVTNEKNNRG